MLIINKLIPSHITSIKRHKLDTGINALIGSDTLFSALCNVALIAGKKTIIEALCKGEIIISSIFPAFKDKLFLPKPILFYETNLATRKKFKNISYLEVQDFAALKNHLNQDRLKVKKDFSPTYSQITIHKYDTAQVAIDILQNGSLPFWEDYLILTEKRNEAVYFLAELPEEFLPDWQTVVRLLAHEGIGGNRTTGHGIFKEARFYTAEIRDSNLGLFINLSLVVPQKEERQFLKSYALAKRGGGFVYQLGGREIIKPFIFTLAEGSVFTPKIKGRVIDLKKEVFLKDFKELPESVFFNGLCLSVPLGGELLWEKESLN